MVIGDPHGYADDRCFRWGLYTRWHRRQQIAWVSSGYSGLISSVWSRYRPVGGERSPRAYVPALPEKCPVDVVEAQQTMRCVAVLEPELRALIVEKYLVGGTIDQQCEALLISTRTYYKRRDRALTLLLGYFQDIANGALPKLAAVDTTTTRPEACRTPAFDVDDHGMLTIEIVGITPAAPDPMPSAS